jgi:hypothetical protein
MEFNNLGFVAGVINLQFLGSKLEDLKIKIKEKHYWPEN